MASQTALSNPYLAISQITDEYVRKNFEAIDTYFRNQNQLLDFKFFELSFTSAQTSYKVAHGLSYIPLDIILTRLSGPGVVSFKYSQFDSTYIVLDVTGACRIRFFAGSYSKLVSTVQTASSDQGQYTSLLGVKTTTAVTARTYQVLTTDDIVTFDCTSNTITATLPSASAYSGKQLWLIKTDASTNTLTIASSATGETINGVTSFTLNSQYDKVLLYSTGSIWVVLTLVKASTLTRLLTVGNGTYVPPAFCRELVIEAVGGGSGGAGGGTNAGPGGSGGAGGTTSFGSLITCTGGASGGTYVPGVGGTATFSGNVVGQGWTGATGAGSLLGITLNGPYMGGFPGGASPFGGAGGGGGANNTGIAAAANTGSGGGGGGCNNVANPLPGSGGGAGGYFKGKINNVLSSYPYSVGAGGLAGTAGTSGAVGGVGGTGCILIWENY